MRLRTPVARAAPSHPHLHRAGGGKKGLPPELNRLQLLLGRGLAATAALWPDIRTAYAWVHRAAHLLGNPDNQPVDVLRRAYRSLLAQMARRKHDAGCLAPSIDFFLKVTRSYWSGLFQCYKVPDLPRTNNDLERFFGAARCHERRVSGQKVAAPSLVVRGSVRLITAVATRLTPFGADQLRPEQPTAWWQLRVTLEHRHAARRAQIRFRRDPAAYLSALEVELIQLTLPP